MQGKRLTSIGFLAILLGLPVGQAWHDLAEGGSPSILGLGAALRSGRRAGFEEELRLQSMVRQHLMPWYQQLLTWSLGRGNERAVEADQGRLFYRDDLDLVTGPGVLEPGVGGARAIEAIVDLRERLEERDIALLVVPVPVKGMLDARFLQWPVPDGPPPVNRDRPAFLKQLEDAGVEVVDLLPEMLAWQTSLGPRGSFLERDTHWRPEVMARVAEVLAGRVEPHLGPGDDRPSWVMQRQPWQAMGDLVELLQLPAPEQVFPPMEFTLEAIREPTTGAAPVPATDAPVLLLGDSFTRIFSDPELGMGQGAGLAEHLAYRLTRPVDVIAVLGGSGTAVRETLARQPTRLDRKRVVVWQFAERLLAAGEEEWRPVDLAPAAGGEHAGPRRPLQVIARVREVSRVPDGFSYRFCLGVLEYEVESVLEGEWPAAEPLWAMVPLVQDWQPTAASRIQPGQRHRLTLDPVEAHHDLERTSWVDDTDAGMDLYFVVQREDAD